MQTRRYHIEWLLLVTALLILGALIDYWVYDERNRVGALERDRLQVQARVIDENLGHQLEGVNNALAGVRNDFLRSDSKSIAPGASRRLKALAAAMPGVRTMLALDAEGTVLASSRDELIGMNFRAREYFKVPRERPDPDMLYVARPFKTVLGAFTINVVRVVTGAKGEFAGIVSATLDPEYFNVVLRSVLYAPDMRVSIAHGDGMGFLYMPQNERAAGIDMAIPGSFFTRHRDSGQTATIMTGIVYATGEERMMARRTIRPAKVPMDKPLVVGVSRDLSAIYAPWRNDALMNSLLYGAIALTSILGLTFTQRRQRKLDRVEADQEIERRERAERHELALRASEEKYRGIYDSLQDLYVETDLDGTILEISPQVETLSGGQYKREDLLGRSAKAFYRDSERRTAFLRTLTLAGSIKDFESTFLNRDGSMVPCSISAIIQLDAGGKPTRIVSMIRDITERKRAEESLRESEERLRAIFEGAVDGILVVVAGSGKFLTGNPAICRMLGYTLEEIVRVGVSDIHPKQDLSRVIEEFERLQRGETQEVADFPVIRKDGSTFRADMQLAPIRLGVTDCALAIVRDISERRRAEEDLRRSAAELRQAYRRLAHAQDEERRALAKELHDQVGQNLSALNLNLHYIDRELTDADRTRLKGRLDDCLVLLDETVARVRSVMGNLRPPMLDEFGLFATLRWWAHETAQRSGIPCVLAGPDLAQRLPVELESALLRIAQEALMNAAKYSKAHEIRIALTAMPQQVQMEIADDGIGFDALARDANVSKPTWGLRTMRERADALGGRVQVISAPGEGTRVVAEIPRA